MLCAGIDDTLGVPVGCPSPLPQVGPLKLVDEQSQRNRFQPSVHVPPFMQGCDSHCGGRTWQAGRMAPGLDECKYKLERHFPRTSFQLDSLSLFLGPPSPISFPLSLVSSLATPQNLPPLSPYIPTLSMQRPLSIRGRAGRARSHP